jgi:hypothetical protein
MTYLVEINRLEDRARYTANLFVDSARVASVQLAPQEHASLLTAEVFTEDDSNLPLSVSGAGIAELKDALAESEVTALSDTITKLLGGELDPIVEE